MKVCVTVPVAAAVLVLLGAPALGQDRGGWRKMSAALGVDYSTGDYGEAQDTDILFAPFVARYQTARFQAKATIPYISIEGPGVVIPGGDGGVVVPGAGVVTRESGLGDIVLQGTYNLYPDSAQGLFVELSGKVKLPTADEEKGLGTGGTDYTVQADAFFAQGPLTPFAMLGYRFRGDSDLFQLDDGLVASAGVSARASSALSLGVLYDYREAATVTSDDASDIVPFLNVKASEGWSVNLYGTVGLTDASPDAGGGVQLKRTFN